MTGREVGMSAVGARGAEGECVPSPPGLAAHLSRFPPLLLKDQKSVAEEEVFG